MPDDSHLHHLNPTCRESCRPPALAGAEYQSCTAGTDCADCAPNTEPPPPAPPALVCDNTCPYAADGDCDDGGPGAEYTTYCGYGTDCGDCGGRSALPTSLRAEAHAEKFTAGDAVAAYQEVRRPPLAPMLARSHAILKICSTA